MNAPLALTASPAGHVLPVGGPVPVRLSLANRSHIPVQVNRRLAVGYADGLYREIFFTVRDRAGRLLPVPDEARVDAHQLPPVRDNFQLLNPGDEVTSGVDLALWYPFEQANEYLVTMHYENSDDGSAFGISAFTGRLDSEDLHLRIG